MTFLQPFILWGLPLILLPVLIHLLNRLRHRPQRWAAMQFLVSATRSSVSNARLRQWLILLLRVLAVLMLVLFLSRPLAGGWLGWALAPAPDAILILLDRSASMEAAVPGGAATKREHALRLLSQAARELEESSHLVLIDSALRAPQEFAKGASLLQLPAAGPTDTAADMPGLVATALQWLVQNRAGTAELWLASDLQRSNWQPDDPRWKSLITQLDALPQRIRIRLLALDQPGDLNRSVTLQELVRRSRGGQPELQFVTDVEASALQSGAFPLSLSLQGRRTQQELVMESQSLRWRHKVSLGDSAGMGWGSFELPADNNPRDNVAFFVYGAEPKLRASLISDPSRGARLLQLAVSAGAGTSIAPILSPGALERAVWEDSTLLVWTGRLPSDATAQRVRGFVEEGGVVLFLPGRSDAQRVEGLGWGDLQSAQPGQSFRIRRWVEDEGPLARSDEGFSLPLASTEFYRRQVIVGQGMVLAAFDDGTPFLVRQTLGQGSVFFCASLPDPEWSSLGEGPVLVPMMQRLLQAGGRRLQQVLTASCGELSAVDQARRWETVDGGPAKDIRIQGGVYRSGERWLAVNRPAREDDPEVLEVSQARQLFGPLGLQLLQERRNQGGGLQGEVWRVFVFCMLLFLVVEGILILPARAAVSAEGRGVPGPAAVRAPAEVGP